MLKRFLFGFAAFVALACGSESEDESTDMADCDGDVPSFDEVSAFQTCAACHSSSFSDELRQSAPPSINFDTYEEARQSANDAVDVVESGAMPPGGSGLTLTADEKEDLTRWALCGTPM